MSKEELPNAEDLMVQLEELAKQNATLKQNQKGLIDENNSLRNTISGNSKLIYKKLLDVKKDLGAIGKNHDFEMNGRRQYSFRGIDDVVNHLFPILNKHNVGIRSKVLQNAEEYKSNTSGKYTKNTRIIMEYTFFAEDGSEVSCQMPAEGSDTSDKGTNKALSAAFKYCLFQCFCIPTELGVVEEGDFERVDAGVVEDEQEKDVTNVTELKPKSKKEAPKKEKASSFRKKKKISGKSKSDDGLEEL